MSKRGRNLAALAALGALGYGYMARGDKQDGKDVPVETRKNTGVAPNRAPATASADDDRDIGGGVHPGGFRRNTETGEMYDPGTVEDRTPRQRPVVSTPGGRVAEPVAPARSMAKQSLLKTDDDFPPVRASAKSTSSTSPGTMGAYVSRAGTRATEPAAGTSTEQRKGVIQASTRGMARPDFSTPEGRKKAEQDQALERVTPEEMLVGGPGLKALHAAAKRLAAPRLAEYSQPLLSGPTARLTGPSRAELNAADRAARDAARRAETARENAARYNTEGPIGGEGFIMKKKGGMVKAKKMASGGMTSASKRADGIAQRGKTKGRMY